ncbi:unnamed protein product, partial [Mesorhabditis belari]|uniref:Uncharacterized protein n=1 Tax=Mesorhabditis belari TaxID=2138241 RepID=A0AAF3EFL9_9BILA
MLRGQESPLWCSAAVAQNQSKDYDTYPYPTANDRETLSGQPTPPYRNDTSPGHLSAYSQITYQTQNQSPDLQMLETVKPGQLVMQQTLKEVDFTWDAPMPDDALNYVPKPTSELQPRSRHNTLTLNQQDSFDSNNSEEEFFNQPTHDRRAVSFGGTSQFARRFNRHNTYNPNLLVVRSQSGRFGL